MKKIIAILMIACFIFTTGIETLATDNSESIIIQEGNEWFTLADIEDDEEEFAFYYNKGLEEINEKRFARSNFYYIGVHKYFQNDPTWGSKLMPCGHQTGVSLAPHTYSKIGCPMTAYAMALKYYGNNVTPEDVAETYQNNYGNCCNFNSLNLLSDYGRSRNLIQVSGDSLQSIATTVVGAISQDKPVVIKLNATSNGNHFVVAYGYSVASDGTVFISIHDPWAINSSASTLVGQYATLNAAYNAGRTAISLAIIS